MAQRFWSSGNDPNSMGGFGSSVAKSGASEMEDFSLHFWHGGIWHALNSICFLRTLEDQNSLVKNTSLLDSLRLC